MKNLALFFSFSFASATLFAQEPTTQLLEAAPETETVEAVADTFELQPDHPICEALDSLMMWNYFCFHDPEIDTNVLNIYGYESWDVPELDEDYVMEQLANLDAESPFNLVYNKHVKGFIKLYSERRRDLTSRVMGLSSLYFPMIEEQLDKHGLPLEFKYLAIVESALRPTARSRSGAVGLWQFMYRTGKIFDLEVNSYVDERMDPYQSTVAACEYFQQLYSMYGNWELVLAAYNCGPGNVNKAIRRSGGKKDYWELWPYLPRETRGYVPAFIAVNYVMNNGAKHNLYPVSPIATFFELDTIHTCHAMNFDQISGSLDISKPLLEYLNPMYKQGIIPATREPMLVCLPADKVGEFALNEHQIYRWGMPEVDADSLDQQLVVEEVRRHHTVQYGEYLGSIANRYNVKVADLKDWNGLRSSRIHPGQKLTIYIKEERTVTAQKTDTQQPTTPQIEYYTIQKGDTLWDIARARGTTVAKLRELNSSLSNTLKPGTKIVVGNPG